MYDADVLRRMCFWLSKLDVCVQVAFVIEPAQQEHLSSSYSPPGVVAGNVQKEGWQHWFSTSSRRCA